MFFKQDTAFAHNRRPLTVQLGEADHLCERHAGIA
jgi:hypothetical protein